MLALRTASTFNFQSGMGEALEKHSSLIQLIFVHRNNKGKLDV